MRHCDEELPTTDDTAIECDGVFVSTDCIIMSKDIPYLGITSGDYLTDVIEKIANKFYDIDEFLNTLPTNTP